MHKYAIVVAGGLGMRMGTALPKQFLLLQGKPVLWHTLTAFLTAFNDMQIIVVLPADFIATGQAIIDTTEDPKRIRVTAGGDTRHQSVKNGLKLVERDSVVFVHDGVRCLVTPSLIRYCYQQTVEKGNAVPAVPATDSIRLVTSHNNSIVDRGSVRIIQTPQTFLANQLLPVFDQPYDPSFTDEASVAERAGIKINLVQGEETNIKITHPLDLIMAQAFLQQQSL